MRQRVFLALALGLRPQLLIADEPFTGLDGPNQKHIIELLGNLRRLHKTAILVISHDLRIIASWADRVAVMLRGEIIEKINRENWLSPARHPYTQTLLEHKVLLEKALEPAPAS
jgi:ABC-type dipeptide/oligopeptide/nickel transport system ATPase component